MVVRRTNNSKLDPGNAHAPHTCCVVARHVDAAGAALHASLSSVPLPRDAPTPCRTAAQPRHACSRGHDVGDAAGPGLPGGASSWREP